MSRAERAGPPGAVPANPAAAIVTSREARLFIALTGLFVTNALIAEFVGVKIFALEDTLGLAPFDWRLFGQSGSLSFTAGVMLWPVVFIMTDVINEHFGVRGVRLISWLAVAFIVYAFLFAYLAIGLAPAAGGSGRGGARRARHAGRIRERLRPGAVDDRRLASSPSWSASWSTSPCSSASARPTGERLVWLRATGSTAVSQLIDSFIVLYIAFVLGPQHWPIPLFLAVGTVNYAYKMAMAIALIPLLYLGRRLIRAYLDAPARSVA